MKNDLLAMLEKDCRLTAADMATMLKADAKTVETLIRELETDGTILGYSAIIDWEKVQQESVMAFIEVKVIPQRGLGFDKVAERIYQYPQVLSCNLMSGGYDLFVAVEGKTMKEVALFVAEKLAPVEFVLSTATHFVLKKYKDKGAIFSKPQKDEREAVVL